MADKTVSILQQFSRPIKLLKWKVAQGGTLSIGRVILLYDFEGATKPEQRKLKSTQAGTVRRLVAQEGAIVRKGEPLIELAPCIHPTVMKDMCGECGADLRKDDLVTTASVPMVHAIPELKVSEELAQKLGKADGDRLLKDRKLVLLVDLDQTLIHTTNDTIPPNIKDVYHFQLYGPNSPWYHTRLRPGTHRFLDNVSPMYELHICTFGARNYAHMITMFLDADQRFFSNRILSRDECFDPTSKKANLKALFPCGDNMVCIIDDREDVWSHATNLIHVKPYHFFQHTGDINAPPGLDKHENDDKPGVDLTKFKMIGSNKKANGNNVDVEEKNEHNKRSDKESKDKIDKEINGGLDKKERKIKKDVDLGGKIEKNGKDDGVENEDEINTDNKEGNKDNKGSSKDTKEGNKESNKDIKKCNKDNKDGSKDNKEVNTDNKKGNKDNKEINTDNKEGNKESNKDNKESNKDNKEGNKDNKGINKDNKGINTDNKESNEDNKEGNKDNKEVNIDHKVGNKDNKKNRRDTEQNDIQTSKKDTENDNEQKENDKETRETKTDREKQEKKPDIEKNNVKDPSEGLIEIEDPDDYLLYLEDILKKIHQTFYDEYDKLESGQVPDLKQVIPNVRSQVLKGCNLVFSGLVPTHLKLHDSKAYQVARSLGANVTQDLQEDTTHLVAVRPGTAKVNAGRRRKNIKIVTPDWLWACAERWERVEEIIFPLNSKGSKNRHPPPHCSSPEHVPSYPEANSVAATQRKRTSSGRFMDMIPTLMCFSSDDLADMGKEVDAFMDDDDDSESDSEEESNKKSIIMKPTDKEDRESSSSDESLTGEFPRGFKRSRKELEEDQDIQEYNDSSNDEFPSTKFRRGEKLDNSDLDLENSDSPGSDEAPDEVDDGDWNMMGAALEREFLSNN